MFKKVLIVFVVLIAGFAAFVATRPADYRVERTATIDAAPQVVFDHVNNFKNWEAWSPWAKLDPNAKMEYVDISSGTGASVRWDGNNDVGAGRQTIIESRSPEFIQIQLDFEKPMKSTSLAEFTFTPQGETQTVVTWSMSGKNNFVGRAMCVFMNMDKMVGGQFEQGLANLNGVVSKRS
jgi:hypothetical protein